MSILSKLFGSKKKDFTYNGPKPVNTLSAVPGGKEYYQNITDRLSGRGVGFGDSYASKYANPIIQNSRNTFENYTMPELQSELSATGRRRGSGGFQQIAQAYKEQGLGENDIFSRLQQRNEDQSRNEINDALGRVGDYAKNEAALQDRAANFEYDKIYAPQVQREQDRMAKEAQGYQGLLDRGFQAAGYAVGGGFSPMSLMPQTSSVSARLATRAPANQNAYYPGVSSLSRTYAKQGQLGRVY